MEETEKNNNSPSRPTTKKKKIKPLSLKCTELTPDSIKKGGHFQGKLYLKDDHEFERFLKGTTHCFNKEGKATKPKIELQCK